MIRIPATEMARLRAHAEEGFPHEVVGILAGRRDGNEVTEVAPLLNERADSPANRYQVGPLALQRAERALEAKGLEIVGYYHSHPDHPAQYSEFDRDHAWPNMSYVIVSVCDGHLVDTRSWRLTDDRAAMSPEDVAIF